MKSFHRRTKLFRQFKINKSFVSANGVIKNMVILTKPPFSTTYIMISAITILFPCMSSSEIVVMNIEFD